MKTFAKGQKPAETPDAAAPATQPSSSSSSPAAAYTTGKGTGQYVSLEYESLDTTADYQEPFALAVYGGFGTGKTRLGATAKGTVGVVPLQRKTRQTVTETARTYGKQIILPKFDLFRSTNPMKSAMLKPNCGNLVHIDINRDQPWCCAVHNGRWAVDRTKQCALDLNANPNVDSVFLDGFDILSEDMLIGHFGRAERIQPRDRGPYNKEMIEFLAALSNKHLVLSTSEKETWKNDKPTGEFDHSGWGHLAYHTNCIVRLTVRENYDADKHDHRWALTVIASQANPALMGVAGRDLLTDDMITFPQLALRVYGGEYEQWE